MLRAERLELERAMLAREVAEARAVCDEAMNLRALATAAPDAGVPIDEQLAARAREAFGAIDDAGRAIEDLERTAAAEWVQINRLHADVARLSREIDELGDVDNVDPSGETTVRDQLAALREVADRPIDPPPAVPEPDPELRRYRNLRTDLLRLAEAPEVRWNPARLGIGALVALLAIGLGVAVTPVAFAGVLITATMVATARNVTVGDALRERLQAEFGIASLEPLDCRVREEDAKLVAARAPRPPPTRLRRKPASVVSTSSGRWSRCSTPFVPRRARSTRAPRAISNAAPPGMSATSALAA